MKNIITTAAIITSMGLASVAAATTENTVDSKDLGTDFAVAECIRTAALEVAYEKLEKFLELNNAYNFEKIEKAFELNNEFAPARNAYLAVNVIASNQ